jgi:hypothetical protein
MQNKHEMSRRASKDPNTSKIENRESKTLSRVLVLEKRGVTEQSSANTLGV